jgi:outer membrane receptor protein involved in Fe transport
LHYGASVHGDVFEQSQRHLNQEEQSLGVERALDGMQTISSVLGSFRLRPTDSLSVSLGGRLDAVQVLALDRVVESSSDAGMLFAASPRLTAAWEVYDPWQLFLSYGRGFRPPEARAFSSYEPGRTGISEELYDGGRPSMTLSDAFELGTRIKTSKFLMITASGFATFIAHEAVFDHVSGLNLELNGTRRLGAELDLRSNPTSWLLLQADATVVDARFVQSGHPVPFAPWLSGSLLAVVTHPLGWRAGLRFFGMAPRALPHGARGAPMARLDATLGYHWDHFHLDLAVENVLNRRIREGEYHYASDWDPTDGASQIPVLHTVAGPPLNARLGFTVVY